MLKDVLPAKYRQILYAAYTVAVAVAGALTVASVNIGKTPDVLTYIGGALGLVAASNVVPAAPAKKAAKAAPKKNEAGAVDPGSLALGLFLGAVIVFLILR